MEISLMNTDRIAVLLILLQCNVLLIDSDSTADAAQRQLCIYSRYMLHYFQLTGMFFENTFRVIPEFRYGFTEEFQVKMDDINTYDEQLRSQGHIVLFMLKKLKDTAPDDPLPDHLMQINLYLNRIQGNTMILVRETSLKPSLIRGYKYYFSKITQSLYTFIDTNRCYDEEMNNATNDDETREIHKLLGERRPLHEYDNEKVLAMLDQRKKRLEEIFLPTSQDGSHVRYHPVYLFFKELFDDKVTVYSSPEDTTIDFLTGNNEYFPDKSLLVRSVVTDYKLANGDNATMYDLFTTAITVLDQKYVISFQRHVLAAVLYPVFMSVSTYLMGIKILFYPGDQKFGTVETRVTLHEKVMNEEGAVLLGHIRLLIGYGIFPKSVQEYLQKVLDQIGDFISIPKKEVLQHVPDRILINKLFDKCSKPMALNNIQYHIGIGKFDIGDEEKMENLVGAVKTQIDDVGLYVESLMKHVETFKNVLGTYDHDKMFKDPPLDLLSMKNIGHRVVNKKNITDDSPTQPLVII